MNQTLLPSSVLAAGEKAPEFTLRAGPSNNVSLSGFRGRNVVLTFYPGDWSPVCTDQLALYNEVLPLLRELNADLLGISVDSVWCHQAFAESRKLHFALLADFEPKGEVSQMYGAYRAVDGTSERALFVVDGRGAIRWSYCSPVDVNPGADGFLDALEAINAEAGA